MKKFKNFCLSNTKFKMKNKKAQIFEGFWVIVTLVVLSIALGSFILIKTKIVMGVSPNSELMNAYNEKDKTIIINEESLKLLVQQAYQDIAEKGAVKGNCMMREDKYVEYNEECKPNTEEIEKMLIAEIKNDKVSLEKDMIALKAEDITKVIEEKGYIDYKVNFTYNPSAKLNISDLNIHLEDFEKIYNSALECKKDDLEQMRECMKKIENWDVELNKTDAYILYDLSTKRNYFFDGSFSTIKLKFAFKL